jgi:site-specific recombinase XerD
MLTPEKLAKELQEATARLDFLRYFRERIDKERPGVSPGYFRKMQSVLKKMEDYLGEVYFADITNGFLDDYRMLLAQKGNKKTTINSNMATIKKILNAAAKDGIKFPLDTQEVKIGSTVGSRVDLSVKELETLFNYYLNEFCPEHWRLTLGYFLFSCFTGMRLSDVLDLQRKSVQGVAHVDFLARKTNKRQVIPITQKCAAVIAHHPRLFTDKVTPEQLNRNLKSICGHLRFSKNISFHVARHTFATNFLRAGGNVVKLQKLLGHSNIRETMIYVHIVEQEANEQINLMDGLF